VNKPHGNYMISGVAGIWCEMGTKLRENNLRVAQKYYAIHIQ